MSKICVVVPSYNEARTIGKIIREVKALGLDIYVVDDGSSDDTAAIAVGERAVVIKHEENMGKGAAIRSGFKRALENNFDAVIIIDGDYQHETSSIADFINTMDTSGADVLIGNRMHDTENMPYVRLQTNRFMSCLISKMCGQYVPDTQCGFRMIKRKVFENVKLESSNFEIESELIIKASRLGFKIGSVPIKTVYEDEKSKINPIIDTLRFMRFIIKMMADKK